MRYASTPRAQLLPSAIAQTMSDWPRCMSPVAKTPGTFVIQFASRGRARCAGPLGLRGAEGGGAGVGAADDDPGFVARPVHAAPMACARAVRAGQILHREVDAGEPPPGPARVAGPRRSARQNYSLE